LKKKTKQNKAKHKKEIKRKGRKTNVHEWIFANEQAQMNTSLSKQ
jgi:hypothetical protein